MDVSQVWWKRSAQKADGIPSSFDDRGRRIARGCRYFMSACLVLKILRKLLLTLWKERESQCRSDEVEDSAD